MSTISRRKLIGGSAAIPGAVALSLLGQKFSWAFGQSSGDFTDDIDVLNYALTLEYLESEFYKQGNSKNLLPDKKEADYLRAIGADEDAHVKAISDTIRSKGGEPVAAPAVDFKDSFASRQKFLETAATFENLGVQAYLGAAGSISDKAILQAAAGIFGGTSAWR